LVKVPTKFSKLEGCGGEAFGDELESPAAKFVQVVEGFRKRRKSAPISYGMMRKAGGRK